MYLLPFILNSLIFLISIACESSANFYFKFKNIMKEINHKYYVSFEVAKLLNKLGFDWECKLYFSELINIPKEAGIFDAITNKVYGVFDSTLPYIANPTENDILRPTLDDAQRWLRETYKVHILINCIASKRWEITLQYFNGNDFLIEDNEFTYEEAQEAGIKKALERIINK